MERMTPNQIRELRLSKKLSRAQFAEKLGVAPRTVEHWEQGNRTPSKSAQILISKVFRVNL